MKKPDNLDEAVEVLIKENAKNIPIDDENIFISNQHHSVGRYIRNSWGLWEDSKLKKWFNAKGIYHPDDMSSIIIITYHRKIKKKPIKLRGQIRKYRKYWAETDPNINKGKL